MYKIVHSPTGEYLRIDPGWDEAHVHGIGLCSPYYENIPDFYVIAKFTKKRTAEKFLKELIIRPSVIREMALSIHEFIIVNSNNKPQE